MLPWLGRPPKGNKPRGSCSLFPPAAGAPYAAALAAAEKAKEKAKERAGEREAERAAERVVAAMAPAPTAAAGELNGGERSKGGRKAAGAAGKKKRRKVSEGEEGEGGNGGEERQGDDTTFVEMAEAPGSDSAGASACVGAEAARAMERIGQPRAAAGDGGEARGVWATACHRLEQNRPAVTGVEFFNEGVDALTGALEAFVSLIGQEAAGSTAAAQELTDSELAQSFTEGLRSAGCALHRKLQQWPDECAALLSAVRSAREAGFSAGWGSEASLR